MEFYFSVSFTKKIMFLRVESIVHHKTVPPVALKTFCTLERVNAVGNSICHDLEKYCHQSLSKLEKSGIS